MPWDSAVVGIVLAFIAIRVYFMSHAVNNMRDEVQRRLTEIEDLLRERSDRA